MKLAKTFSESVWCEDLFTIIKTREIWLYAALAVLALVPYLFAVAMVQEKQ